MPDIRLFHGDCLEIMPQLSDQSIDCIICDPPFATTACKWDTLIPFDKLWKQYNRLLKPQGSVLLFGSEPFSTHMRMSNIKAFKYDWIWKKNNATGFQHAKNMPRKNYEIISVFSNASMGHENLLGDRRMIYNPQGVKDVHWEVRRSSSKFGNIVGKRASHKREGIQELTGFPTAILEFPKDRENFHPTQKPVALLAYLIKTYTNADAVVLDNCMGSGSTGIAALETNRSFIGIEKDEYYFNIAKNRIEQKRKQGIQGELFNDQSL